MKTKRKTHQALQRKFDLRRPRNGQLVVTAEIHRVTNCRWGKGKGAQYSDCIEVQTLAPKGGRHIMSFGKMGQQCVMILKTQKRNRRKN
jgi:hypothetical protein